MKVLIADDDLNLNQGLALLLQKEGFTCKTVTNGQDALIEVEAYQPDVCVFDVLMPLHSGIELCAIMREQQFFQPVLLLTAFDEQVDKIEGFRLGADDYMTKPFDPDELVARLTALFRRQQYSRISNQQQPNTAFSFGDLKVDADRMLLMFNNHQLSLSERELAFLKLLYESAGKVLTKDEILDRCWGRAYLPNSRTLDQFLSVLRKKIEKELGAPKLIRTIYGVGYTVQEIG